jgi:hypothetical protein
MYKCLKCNKEFQYESKYIIHKNRKTECSKNKNFNCNIRNKEFQYESKLQEHEKTKKHIINMNNYTINDNNNLENISNLNSINYEEKYNKLLIEMSNLNSINYEEKYNKLLIEISNLQSKYYELQNKNNNLLEKFNLLEKLSSKESNNNEYIYIVHERTFVKTNANIYKIGKTKNIKNRLNGYSKGSKLLFTIPCNDCSLMETIILNYLKSNNNYIQVKEIGRAHV